MEPNSDLDQHFLIDRSITNTIIDALEVEPQDVVLEIGPGKGALTKIIPKCKRIIVVEKDPRLIAGLKQLPNIDVVHGNGLQKIDVYKFTKLLTNTPYAIIEPLIKKMIFVNFHLAVIVVGKSTAQHLAENNIFSLIANSFFEITEIKDIPAEAFNPKPKTVSTILVFKKKKSPLPKEKIVQEIYLQHDKLLKNALREYFVRASACTKKEANKKVDDLALGSALLEKHTFKLSYLEWENLIEKILEK